MPSNDNLERVVNESFHNALRDYDTPLRKVSVKEIVGHKICVASADGDRVFKVIDAFISGGKGVELSFKNVEILTSAFLNSAIGSLYWKYSKKRIDAFLKIVDTDSADKILIEKIIDNAIGTRPSAEKEIK